MIFRLYESTEKVFNKVEEIEYDASEVVSDEDQRKVSGSVYVRVSPNEMLTVLWDCLCDDTHPPITESEFELYSDNDALWEAYVEEHYDELWDRYEEEIREEFQEDAASKVYDNWDRYSDESAYSQRDDDEREYWRLVWGR